MFDEQYDIIENRSFTVCERQFRFHEMEFSFGAHLFAKHSVILIISESSFCVGDIVFTTISGRLAGAMIISLKT
jgi:hypothetical protein